MLLWCINLVQKICLNLYELDKYRRCVMKKNMMSRTLSVHQEHELLLRLETADLTEELAQKIIGSKNNRLAIEMIRIIKSCLFESTMSQESARGIMSKNFFGIEEAIRYYGVNPTPQQCSMLAEVPFSGAVLRECKDTHILIAIFPLSVLDIREEVQDKGLFRYKGKESFIEDEECGECSWQLICKTPVNNLTLKNWQEQQLLLTNDEEVPDARIMTYTIIGHYLVTGERLFKSSLVRTSSMSKDNRLAVGLFNSDGLIVLYYHDDEFYDGLLVASARKK